MRKVGAFDVCCVENSKACSAEDGFVAMCKVTWCSSSDFQQNSMLCLRPTDHIELHPEYKKLQSQITCANTQAAVQKRFADAKRRGDANEVAINVMKYLIHNQKQREFSRLVRDWCQHATEDKYEDKLKTALEQLAAVRTKYKCTAEAQLTLPALVLTFLFCAGCRPQIAAGDFPQMGQQTTWSKPFPMALRNAG
jgi:hypothetical protein